jgi:putative aminopeptidase FrvX
MDQTEKLLKEIAEAGSVPIHSHNAMLCRDAYDQALQLVVAVVERLDAETVARLTT